MVTTDRLGLTSKFVQRNKHLSIPFFLTAFLHQLHTNTNQSVYKKTSRVQHFYYFIVSYMNFVFILSLLHMFRK